jgi:hypothetical protein
MNTLRVAALGVLAAQVAARCNNDCNQHGVCNAGSTCECERGFVGNDCAERLCYFGEAFIDTPLGDINANQAVDTDQQVYFHHNNAPVGEQYDPAYGLARSTNTAEWDEGHFYRECSNKGTCNRATGECECFPGFEGAGCTRQVCPDDCNGHGMCVGADSTNADYLAWDLTHTQSCVCDPGYTGPSCSLRKCPVGVDPIANVYTNTDSVWKIEFSTYNETVYDTTNMRYLPNGEVHWTMTYTDEMGDEWTTSAVTSYYQTRCAGTLDNTDPTATCSSYPFHSNPRNETAGTVTDVSTAGDVATDFYGDSAFTFDSSFIAEQVNASIAALPNDVTRGAYVWVTHTPGFNAADDYLIYPSYGVPQLPFTRVDTCSANNPDNCTHISAFSEGASLAVNDARYRFPYFVDLDNTDDLSSTDITNCSEASVCVFIRLPISSGTQDLSVSYKYKAEIRNSTDLLVGEYAEAVGHSRDGSIVRVVEVGSNRHWSVETDGTPRIAYNSDQELHACSRRGLCDYETGLCECFSGYSGYKCDQRSILGY